MLDRSRERAAQPDVEVRGSLLRGLIDHIVRTEGGTVVRELLREAGHPSEQILPEVWYPRSLMQDLMELHAERSGATVQAVARKAGRRMASSSLEGLEDALCFVPPEKLMARLEWFVRIGDRRAIRLETDGETVHLMQDPPSGPHLCALFHGIVEGLLDHLEAEGCIEKDAVRQVRCRAQDHDRCEYHLEWSVESAS